MTCEDSGVPKRSSKPKKKAKKPPTDLNALASFIVERATAEPEDKKEQTPEELAHAAAVALGRLGGLKGGKARAKSLTKKRRAEIAKKAAKARWSK